MASEEQLQLQVLFPQLDGRTLRAALVISEGDVDGAALYILTEVLPETTGRPPPSISRVLSTGRNSVPEDNPEALAVSPKGSLSVESDAREINLSVAIPSERGTSTSENVQELGTEKGAAGTNVALPDCPLEKGASTTESVPPRADRQESGAVVVSSVSPEPYAVCSANASRSSLLTVPATDLAPPGTVVADGQPVGKTRVQAAASHVETSKDEEEEAYPGKQACAVSQGNEETLGPCEVGLVAKVSIPAGDVGFKPQVSGVAGTLEDGCASGGVSERETDLLNPPEPVVEVKGRGAEAEEEDEEALSRSIGSLSQLGSQFNVVSLSLPSLDAVLDGAKVKQEQLRAGLQEMEALQGHLAEALKEAARAEDAVDEERTRGEQERENAAYVIQKAWDGLVKEASTIDGEKSTLQLEAHNFLSRLQGLKLAGGDLEERLGSVRVELQKKVEAARARAEAAKEELKGLLEAWEERRKADEAAQAELAARQQALKREQDSCEELREFLALRHLEADKLESALLDCSEKFNTLARKMMGVAPGVHAEACRVEPLACLPAPSGEMALSSSTLGSIGGSGTEQWARSSRNSGADAGTDACLEEGQGADAEMTASASSRSQMRAQFEDLLSSSEGSSAALASGPSSFLVGSEPVASSITETRPCGSAASAGLGLVVGPLDDARIGRSEGDGDGIVRVYEGGVEDEKHGGGAAEVGAGGGAAEGSRDGEDEAGSMEEDGWTKVAPM